MQLHTKFRMNDTIFVKIHFKKAQTGVKTWFSAIDEAVFKAFNLKTMRNEENRIMARPKGSRCKKQVEADSNAGKLPPVEQLIEKLNLTKEQQGEIRTFSARAGNQAAVLVSGMVEGMLANYFADLNARNEQESQAGILEPSRLLQAKDVAKALGISKSLAYRLMQSGEIQTINIGASVRVKPEDLKEYIRERSKKK